MSESIIPPGFDSLAGHIRAFEARVSQFRTETTPPAGVDKPSFADLMSTSIRAVNEIQGNARTMAERYERGEDVPLTDVVLSAQRASLAFETTLQVRNKLLRAYEEIMSMPV